MVLDTLRIFFSHSKVIRESVQTGISLRPYFRGKRFRNVVLLPNGTNSGTSFDLLFCTYVEREHEDKVQKEKSDFEIFRVRLSMKLDIFVKVINF